MNAPVTAPRLAAPDPTVACEQLPTSAASAGRLSWRERMAYGAGDVGSCLYYAIFISYLTYFYTDIFGISATAVGTMIVVVRTIDWITDFIMGGIADRTRSRWGRYRPWILWSIPFYVVVGILMFYTPEVSVSAKLVYAYITYTLTVLVYTMVNVPYSALMGVITPSSDERTVLSAVRMVGAGVSALIVNATLLPLVAFFGQGSDQRGFTLAVTLYAVLAAGAFWFTFACTRERLQPPPAEGATVRSDLRLLCKNGPWLALIAVGLLTIIAAGVRSGATVHYFKYVSGNELLAAGFGTVGAIVQIICVCFTQPLVRAIGGKKRTFAWLTGGTALLYLGFYFIPADAFTLILIHQVISTIVGAPIIAIFFAMIADTASYGWWKFNQRSTGILFSAGTFSLKIGWSIGPALSMWILGMVGFQANVAPTAEVIQAIRLLMSVVPGAVAAVTVAVLIAFYHINTTTEREMQTALSTRIA